MFLRSIVVGALGGFGLLAGWMGIMLLRACLERGDLLTGATAVLMCGFGLALLVAGGLLAVTAGQAVRGTQVRPAASHPNEGATPRG